MAFHNDLGKKGEEIALKYLKDKGYKILDINWRFNKDEIDIIARDNDSLVIIEVKTRSTDYFGPPEDAVDERKEKYLIRATEAYIDKNNLDIDSRFDIISIISNKYETSIDHIIDAFYPEL
jgi:putative endonuclease